MIGISVGSGKAAAGRTLSDVRPREWRTLEGDGEIPSHARIGERGTRRVREFLTEIFRHKARA